MPLIEDDEVTSDNNQDLSDDQIDSLVDSGEDFNPKEDIPETKVEQPKDPFANFTLDVNGKQIVPKDLDQVKKWAQMGYNYAQHMNEFNTQKQQFDSKFKHYSDIDQFAQQNPEWWDHVNNSFTQKGQNLEQQKNPLDQQSKNSDNNKNMQEMVEQVLQSKYGPKFEQFDNFLHQQKLEQQSAEDMALDSEIKTIREQNSDLDWENLDETGKSLESRILEHANINGIPSFKTAFRDFYHDKLLHKVELRGYEKAKQEIQKNKKLGLLGETPAPLKSFKIQKNLKDLSYDDIANEIMEELERG